MSVRAGVHTSARVKFFMNFKKSQSDMLGITVIVAFLVFVILFVVFLSINRAESNLKSEYRQNSLTSNLLTTIFRTTTSCSHYSVSELIVDCAKEMPTISCQGVDSLGNLVIKNSCAWADLTIGLLLSRTLDEWNEAYTFNITNLPTMPQGIYFYHGDCENISEDGGMTPSVLPIPVVDAGKTVYATLTVCR